MKPAPLSATPSTARARACTPTSIASARPEIFFKGTARVCVGPGQAIGIRVRFEVHRARAGTGGGAGQQGHVSSATRSANDVSAWDIERENALYLPQSKVYAGCCALGPVIVTADELPIRTTWR